MKYVMDFMQDVFGKILGTLIVVLVLALLLGSLGRGMFFNHIDQHEVGYRYDLMSGDIATIERKGYHFSWPFIIQIGAIDARPRQVCIAGKVNGVKDRVLNCKLVQFDKKGMKTFIRWHSRNFGDLDEILKAYAYSGQKKEYPFLRILSEIGAEGSTLNGTNTDAQTAEKPANPATSSEATEPSEDYFK